jgi:hypothetical protein
MTQDTPSSDFVLAIDAASLNSPFLNSPVEIKGRGPLEIPDEYYVYENRLYCIPKATPRPCGTRAASFRWTCLRDVAVVLEIIRENIELFHGRLRGVLFAIRCYLSLDTDEQPGDDVLSEPCNANWAELYKNARALNFWLAVDMFCNQPGSETRGALFCCLESLLDSEDDVWSDLEDRVIRLA